MANRKAMLAGACLFPCLFLLSAAASAQAGSRGAHAAPAKFSYVTFSVPGATGTYPVDLNIDGTVTGWWYDSKSVQHGFVRTSDGTIATFDVPGADSTVPTNIAKRGNIVGSYTSKGRSHGFLRTPRGKLSTIDIRGANDTYAEAVTPQGTIVGFYTTRDRTRSFQLTSDGTLVTFACKGATETRVYAIMANPADILGKCNVDGGALRGFVRSADGRISDFAVGKSPRDISPNDLKLTQAVGAWTDNRSKIHGFIFDRGTDAATTLDLGDDEDTEAVSVTIEGVVAGYFSDGTAKHGFLRAPDGTLTVLDVPKSRDTFLVRINNRGQGTGYYRTTRGHILGFVLHQ